MHINRHTDTRYSYTKRVKGSHAMARVYNTSCHISHTTQCRSLAIGSEQVHGSRVLRSRSVFSGKGNCAHVGAGGGTVVSSGGSSLASGKCSGEGSHNVELYMFTHCQDNTLRLLVKIRLS